MDTATTWTWVCRYSDGDSQLLGTYPSREDLFRAIEHHFAGTDYRVIEERETSRGYTVVTTA